ncbi:hypothetical protein Dimus_000333 [Dionaea muscipula]
MVADLAFMEVAAHRGCTSPPWLATRPGCPHGPAGRKAVGPSGAYWPQFSRTQQRGLAVCWGATHMDSPAREELALESLPVRSSAMAAGYALCSWPRALL